MFAVVFSGGKQTVAPSTLLPVSRVEFLPNRCACTMPYMHSVIVSQINTQRTHPPSPAPALPLPWLRNTGKTRFLARLSARRQKHAPRGGSAADQRQRPWGSSAWGPRKSPCALPSPRSSSARTRWPVRAGTDCDVVRAAVLGARKPLNYMYSLLAAAVVSFDPPYNKKY